MEELQFLLNGSLSESHTGQVIIIENVQSERALISKLDRLIFNNCILFDWLGIFIVEIKLLARLDFDEDAMAKLLL